MPSLQQALGELALASSHRLLVSDTDVLTVADALTLDAGTTVAGADASVALCIREPAAFVRSLLGLDGRVAQLLLLSPALPPDLVAALSAGNASPALVSDRDDLPGSVGPATAAQRVRSPAAPAATTTWLMTTSGTTGTPTTAGHSLGSLTRSVQPPRPGGTTPAWGLLYDPSRFAGLQVVLQSLLGGGTLLVPDPTRSLPDRLTFLADHGCTHLSATPTFWRKILMTPAADQLDLRQVTLGGETANDRTLRALARRFPAARVTHVYASTEVGVGFAVNDGRAGFPLTYLTDGHRGVALKVVDGLLWARAPGAPAASQAPVDAEGFLCTGDRIDVRADRALFLGRASSAVNVGGTKVHVEDVERVVAGHPGVGDCVVDSRPSAVMGALLRVTIVPDDLQADRDELKRSVKRWCREHLAREAQPAVVTIVDELTLTAAGKVSRT